jgi:tetratricopeptide (TPR) repeat protein
VRELIVTLALHRNLAMRLDPLIHQASEELSSITEFFACRNRRLGFVTSGTLWLCMRSSSQIQRSFVMILFIACSGWAALSHGHGAYHEELERADEEIAAHPEDGQLWYRRGFLNVLHGAWESALVDLEKADRLAPGKFATNWLRGQALTTAGQFAAARAVLNDFIAQYPDHGGALASRARALVQLKEHTAALADYRAALTKTPNAEPDLVQEVVEALIFEQQNEEAADLLEVHLKRLGNSPGLVMKALELEVVLGRYDAALSRVDVLQQTAPRPEPWMAKRASILAQAGRIRESQAAWQELITHLQALPNLERGAHSMQLIAEQAHQALASLKTLSQTTPPTP